MKGKLKGKAANETPAPPALPAVPKSYEPTANESAAAQRLLDRRKREPPAPRFKVTYGKDNKVSIDADHAEPICTYAQLADMMCTGDLVFSEGLMHQLADASRAGRQLTARELNFMLATVRAIGPRDPTEALLASQMASIHNATMCAVRRLNHVETIDQQDSASNMINKLARTFAAQVETLKRYRADGEQKVTVQHQHVNVSANQAVVGISQGGGGAHEKSSQPHVPSGAHEQSPPMLGHEQAVPMPMPRAGSDRLARVPVPRCTERSTEGKSQRRVAPRDGDQ